MANMVDYVKEHTETIAEDGFNDSDGLVLAELAYLKWEYLLEMSDEELANKGIPYTQQQLIDLVGKGGSGMSLQDLVGYLMMTDYYTSLYQSYLTGGLDDDSRKKDEIALMLAIQSSDRFRDMTISNIYYVSVTRDEVDTLEDLEQFAAVTFTYQSEDGHHKYVAFRGTDGTLEGWCEDFN
ncbi:MAG: DUF2974 domain-containing protein, partial [Clostridiales bacterium]|nr:DUF2974 domain-containing protein [Clostridiales bacterium]